MPIAYSLRQNHFDELVQLPKDNYFLHLSRTFFATFWVFSLILIDFIDYIRLLMQCSYFMLLLKCFRYFLFVTVLFLCWLVKSSWGLDKSVWRGRRRYWIKLADWSSHKGKINFYYVQYTRESFSIAWQRQRQRKAFFFTIDQNFTARK